MEGWIGRRKSEGREGEGGGLGVEEERGFKRRPLEERERERGRQNGARKGEKRESCM